LKPACHTQRVNHPKII